MGRQTAKRRGWEKRLDFSLRFAAPAPEKAKKKVPEDDGGGEEKASKEEKEKVCREGGGRGKTVFPRSVSISLIHLFSPPFLFFYGGGETGERRPQREYGTLHHFSP